jgi:hypothetical protein
MELDGLYVPAHAHWYPAFLSESLNFPAGKHDDQVDALGFIGQLLDRMKAVPHSDYEIRFMNNSTTDQSWHLAGPKRLDWNAQILGGAPNSAGYGLAAQIPRAFYITWPGREHDAPIDRRAML